jgi:hypothetical protein
VGGILPAALEKQGGPPVVLGASLFLCPKGGIRVRKWTPAAQAVWLIMWAGGVTVSTELFAAKRHAGVWAPVIACKNRIANTEFALAA